MSKSPYMPRVTIGRMLMAVLFLCVSLGLTRGVLVTMVSYKITPNESVDALLAWGAIIGAGAVFGLAIGQFFAARKTFALVGACVWALLLLSCGDRFFEILQLDRVGWVSPEARQTRRLVYWHVLDGGYLAAGGTFVPEQDIDKYLQQLENEGLLETTRANRGGIGDGRDWWGRKLIVELDNNVLRVRSKGRDGIDQNGDGDDIEARADLHDYSPIVKVKPELPERQTLFDWF